MTTVFVDIDTNNVVLYCNNEDDSEFYYPDETCSFYPTLKEAEDALNNYRRDLMSKFKDTKKYLEIMENWADDEEFDDIKRDEYLPRHLISNDKYWEKEYKMCSRECEYLYNIIDTGFININGTSFKAEDVKQIFWGKTNVKLSLANGENVITDDETEHMIIKHMFGKNPSRRIFTNL